MEINKDNWKQIDLNVDSLWAKNHFFWGGDFL